jgi:hypothetical protein
MCALAATAPLSALTVKPMSFVELVESSTAVVHGRVTDVHGQWTADRRGIDSVLTVDVIDYFKGGLGERVSVRVPGGQVGSIVNVVPGAAKFVAGDRVVLFLKVQGPAIPVVTGTTQGVYRVITDGRSGELAVLPPVVDNGSAGPIVRGDPSRRPIGMSRFADAVKSAEEAR